MKFGLPTKPTDAQNATFLKFKWENKKIKYEKNDLFLQLL